MSEQQAGGARDAVKKVQATITYVGELQPMPLPEIDTHADTD